MANEDTTKLLRECNAGVKMGVSSIDDVLPRVQDASLRQILSDSRREHEKLGDQTWELLNQNSESGKEPNPIAKGMSWVKTNMMLAMEHEDQTIAGLISDGCHMGVKSLSRYLNEYGNAETQSKDIARNLIGVEEKLGADMRQWL